MIVSRPKTVMNHGIQRRGQAAEDGEAELRMRGARSATDWLYECERSSQPARSCGTRRPPGGERLAHVQQLVAEPPLDEARRDALAVERRDDRDLELPVSRGPSSTAKVIEPFPTSPRCEKTTCVRAALRPGR